VVAVGHEVVVYTRPGRGARGQPTTLVWSCHVGVRQFHILDNVSVLQKAAVSGTTVAYASTQEQGVDTSSTSVTVADAVTGALRFSAPAGRLAVAPSSVSVDALAVSSDGTVAWIQHGGTAQGSGYSVYAASPAHPGGRQLARGAAIKPGSLTLRGSTVSWLAGGRRQSAGL
jgi:hypothetical protein